MSLIGLSHARPPQFNVKNYFNISRDDTVYQTGQIYLLPTDTLPVQQRRPNAPQNAMALQLGRWASCLPPGRRALLCRAGRVHRRILNPGHFHDAQAFLKQARRCLTAQSLQRENFRSSSCRSVLVGQRISRWIGSQAFWTKAVGLPLVTHGHASPT